MDAQMQTGFTGRPYYRSCLWHDVSSVCRLSVCDVLYCGETVRFSEQEAQLKLGVADSTAP